MIRLTTPAIVNWSVLRLPDGLYFSRLVRRPACTSSTSESPTIHSQIAAFLQSQGQNQQESAAVRMRGCQTTARECSNLRVFG
jgi:hypothetical protein